MIYLAILHLAALHIFLDMIEEAVEAPLHIYGDI